MIEYKSKYLRQYSQKDIKDDSGRKYMILEEKKWAQQTGRPE